MRGLSQAPAFRYKIQIQLNEIYLLIIFLDNLRKYRKLLQGIQIFLVENLLAF